MQPMTIEQDAYRIAPDTWVIPHLVPSGPETLASIKSRAWGASTP